MALDASLASVPGLAGFLAKRQMNEQAPLAQMQQLGGAMNLAQMLEAAKKKREAEAAIAALGPNPSQEDVVRVSTPFISPEKRVDVHQKSLDRAATAAAAKEQRAAMLAQAAAIADQTHEIKMAGLRTEAEKVVETGRHNKQMELIQGQLAELKKTSGQAVSPTEILDPSDPTRMLKIDARTYKGGTLGAPGVIGVAGKEPSAAKRDEQVGQGREGVSSLITTLRDQYGQLKQGGGITDPKAGVMANVQAATSASGPGQFVGRMVGTQNQSVRNQIAQQRPLLLQAIKQATGMSAKQMDSNAEMKLYLAAATDPTLDIRANLAALDKLDELYGLGGKLGKPGTPATTPGKPGVLRFDAQGNPVR